MDELTFTEKKLLKEYFEMESGYFLNMFDDEFSQFFKQFGVDIDNIKYTTQGMYQIDRFSNFLEIEDKNIVLKILKEAHQYKKHFVEKRCLVNPTDLRLRGIDTLIDTKITDLIHRLSGEETKIEEELEINHLKTTPKDETRNIIKSYMRLVRRGLEKRKEKVDANVLIDHPLVEVTRKNLEQYSKDLAFRVPGDKRNTKNKEKGSVAQLKKWAEEVLKED